MPNNKTCQLELKEAHAQLFKYAEDLHKAITMLKNSHLELEMAYVDTVNRLAQAVKYKDEATGDHVLRICFFSATLAHALGLSNEKILSHIQLRSHARCRENKHTGFNPSKTGPTDSRTI